MNLWARIFGKGKAERLSALGDVQQKFSLFKALLDRHNEVLRSMSRLEEALRHGGNADCALLAEGLGKLLDGVEETVSKMIQLGGDEYSPLSESLKAIRGEILDLTPGSAGIVEDEYVLDLARVDRYRVHSTGEKSANLGESKSRLGLAVPDGFAITGWAYKRFVESNGLEVEIKHLIGETVTRDAESVASAAERVRSLVMSRPVPDDLASAILVAHDELVSRKPAGTRIALRSSAIGEDSPFTFAGQYATFLAVDREGVLDGYRGVLASKFSQAAIHYYITHDLWGSDLAMCVTMMEMVDARASGVLYTTDPLDPGSGTAIVSSVLGLGKYLVDGTLTPDLFRISRNDGRVLESRISPKRVQLVWHAGGGFHEAAVPDQDRVGPSLSGEVLDTIVRSGLAVESHYGGPQDIEWSLARDGRLLLLQTRPLRVMEGASGESVSVSAGMEPILGGGTTICPGAASGLVFHLSSPDHLASVPEGAILVALNPSPSLLQVMPRVGAIITEVGGIASHMAILARETGLPCVAGLAGAWQLDAGAVVTVDATTGSVFVGGLDGLIASRRAEARDGHVSPRAERSRRVLDLVAKLTMLHPSDPSFVASNCRTLHDVTRFVHQKAMEEMFVAARKLSHKDQIGARLKTGIPLLINMIYLDRDQAEVLSRRVVPEDRIGCEPMQAFWNGVLLEGWPERPAPADLRGFLAVVGTNIERGHQQEFSESSYAFLGREYMLLSLRMGYHFATIEGMATPDPPKNYVRMTFKEGGAPLERRIRRVRLLVEILGRLGFENRSENDFLDTVITNQESETTLRLLGIVGRLTILTKQLDMALSSDAVSRWYTDSFLDKLGLAGPGIQAVGPHGPAAAHEPGGEEAGK